MVWTQREIMARINHHIRVEGQGPGPALLIVGLGEINNSEDFPELQRLVNHLDTAAVNTEWMNEAKWT